MYTKNRYSTDIKYRMGTTRKTVFLTRTTVLDQESTVEALSANPGMDAPSNSHIHSSHILGLQHHVSLIVLNTVIQYTLGYLRIF